MRERLYFATAHKLLFVHEKFSSKLCSAGAVRGAQGEWSTDKTKTKVWSRHTTEKHLWHLRFIVLRKRPFSQRLRAEYTFCTFILYIHCRNVHGLALFARKQFCLLQVAVEREGKQSFTKYKLILNYSVSARHTYTTVWARDKNGRKSTLSILMYLNTP